jgi:hypothetical protein
MALVFLYVLNKPRCMKKVWGIAREMIRVVCVCVVFPGVDMNLEDISCYFHQENREEK